MIRIEVVEGVVIEVDESKWGVRGIPLELKLQDQPFALQFDLSVAAPGDHTSKLENVLSLSKVRR